ncbi:MAG: hypothetical protein KAS73_10995 [Candidatus Sabulitectum sp.]|nr:hypothetical protein [Candidatus Sabulitectum sp.]
MAMRITVDRRAKTLLVLLLLTILSFTGVLTKFQQKVILPPAENYIEKSQEKALTAFITISIVKGLVAVVEGSDVVGIEVGDIVQPLYDSIDITWKLIAASLATLYALEIILELCGFLGSLFLGIVFILLGLMQFKKKEQLRKFAFFFGVLAFSFYFAIPASLFLSGKLSNSYSAPIQDEFDLRMGEFEENFESRLEEAKHAGLIEIEGWPPRVTGSLTNLSIEWPDLGSISSPQYQVIAGIVVDMKDLIDVLPQVLLRTGATWLLDVMIIPLGMLFLLYKLAILFTDSFLGSARADKLERAVGKNLEKHLRK